MKTKIAAVTTAGNNDAPGGHLCRDMRTQKSVFERLIADYTRAEDVALLAAKRLLRLPSVGDQ